MSNKEQQTQNANLNMAVVGKSVFNPQLLETIFSNVKQKECNVIGYQIAYEIRCENVFIGELFYSESLNEWFFIKDNYPLSRKGYRINFPIKSAKFMIELFRQISVELVEIS